MSLLDSINSPEDLKKLNYKEKKQLAQELREFILENVSKTGGHLASNLGSVELTIALHSIFDTPKDKVIWDVGHQTYSHKILTGRKNDFYTLRQFKGLSGFPKRSESVYDVFDTGHSSTSISAALGMARARDIKGEKYKVVAVIGDGAMTGGMAEEALNDAGSCNTNLIVILNDNEMSIEKNTGGLAKALTKMRTKRFYMNSNKYIKSVVLKIPKLGTLIVKIVRRIKYEIKKLMLPDMMFEEIGFKYLGPVNGHDIEKLENLMKRAKDLDGPIIIHVKTIKGKGYRPAELNPDKYHSVSNFDIETGNSLKKSSENYSKVFGEKLCEIAKNNKKVVAITAAMTDGTGLSKFKEEFPKRFFDVEIAEQHALTLSAGFACGGCIPVVCIYSSFLQRGYDQIIHDIAIQNLHVVIGVDRAGIVGADGETHQGLFDLAFLRVVPNMTIMAPKNFEELQNMLEFAINKISTPVAIRYPRGLESKTNLGKCEEIEYGKSEIIDKSLYIDDDVKNIYISGDENKKRKEQKIKIYTKIKIIAIGNMVSKAVEVAQILYKRDGIKADIINSRFLKPFDNSILDNGNQKQIICTIEDGTLKGGLYTEVLEQICKNNIKNTIVKGFGYNDCFVQQGPVGKLEEINGLGVYDIYNDIIKCNVFENKNKTKENRNVNKKVISIF